MDDQSAEKPALSGLRVLDAGTTVAGPFAGTLLADLGADVLCIEKPAAGDTVRDWMPKKDGVSLWWKVSARNKRMVTLDLRQPEGRDLFLQLVRESDAVIENFRPGTFERWGLSYEELAKANPSVILVRVSGYGQSGPYAERPGYGTIAEAISGIPSYTGMPDGPPTLAAFPFADVLAGLFATVGLLSAVRERDRSEDGIGQQVDVSLVEACLRIVEGSVIAYDQLGEEKKRQGNRLDAGAPRNLYPTRDKRWIALSASSNRTFQRLAEAIGRPELAREPRFATNSSRVHNVEALDQIITSWLESYTCNEALSIFDEYDVVAGPVNGVAEVAEDPHLLARAAIVDVPDEDFGSVRMPGVVPKFSRSSSRIKWTGSGLGQDNEAVFEDLLNLGASELAALARKGIV